MPHLHIEYSPGLERHVDVREVCRAAHQVMSESALFPLAGIRIRAFAADYCIVADDHPDNEFLAMTLSVGSGRAQSDLKAAGERLFAAVQRVLADPLATPHFALSLEIREIDAALSWKDTPIHARLSKQ
ncbi:5-carboxymethyl-2-hydroxymuconate Delta-isomerase [Salinicola sp. JS01]|uniref:5-carboxymethyl-2-hydroxymuconate Delta-isomerase n=1 Tax=unclassified Salinicola TaxID=2634022 RepID=UPI001A8D910F|nr:5-carboxymethyl-2-hydroxymuconate Delta-isomerase [Salinicola sp. JS01]MCE3028101.1 5-carboxymethyl-2-hydroxymuconate Delta-isomerase [Salinicola sp. DM10]WIX32661.1 5-carboxymethyl-2-hydroxymuconate Delta-isomerase [Salinicola sp. JS01]